MARAGVGVSEAEWFLTKEHVLNKSTLKQKHYARAELRYLSQLVVTPAKVRSRWTLTLLYALLQNNKRLILTGPHVIQFDGVQSHCRLSEPQWKPARALL